jgi:hypothetical protein
MRGEAKVTLPQAYCISLPRYIAVNKHGFYTSAFQSSCFVLSAMVGKIKQRVCVKFCVELGKSPTETIQMLREAFGEYSLSRTAVFEWDSRFKAGRRRRTFRATKHQQNDKILNKFENSSTESVAEHSMSSQTPFRSVMEFARRS